MYICIYTYIEREEDIEVYRIYSNIREAGFMAKDSQSSEFGDLGRVLMAEGHVLEASALNPYPWFQVQGGGQGFPYSPPYTPPPPPKVPLR